MVRLRNFLIALSIAAFLVCGSLLTPGLADGGANHQEENNNYGVSGGNINDISRRFCCSGTLGSLITINGSKYILSNNHVLNRSDQGRAGDDISQPGLIDNNCQVPRIVADLSAAPPLGSNVDAAIALLRPGTMNTTGFIEDIGIPSSTIATAAVGMSVAKSGRTTGFTTGSVTSTNTSVSVQYQRGCGGGGKKFIVSYTDQVVIGGAGFSAGGDSGSLIVRNNADHNPVALLFAGSSTSTIGNPIGEVLTKVAAALGGTATFSGSAGGPGRGLGRANQEREPFTLGVAQLQELPQQASDRASAVLEMHRANLMFQPGVIGAGVGSASDDNLQAAIVVYVDRTSSSRPQLLKELDGIPVRVVLTDPFVAF